MATKGLGPARRKCCTVPLPVSAPTNITNQNWTLATHYIAYQTDFTHSSQLLLHGNYRPYKSNDHKAAACPMTSFLLLRSITTSDHNSNIWAMYVLGVFCSLIFPLSWFCNAKPQWAVDDYVIDKLLATILLVYFIIQHNELAHLTKCDRK